VYIYVHIYAPTTKYPLLTEHTGHRIHHRSRRRRNPGPPQPWNTSQSVTHQHQTTPSDPPPSIARDHFRFRLSSLPRPLQIITSHPALSVFSSLASHSLCIALPLSLGLSPTRSLCSLLPKVASSALSSPDTPSSSFVQDRERSPLPLVAARPVHALRNAHCPDLLAQHPLSTGPSAPPTSCAYIPRRHANSTRTLPTCRAGQSVDICWAHLLLSMYMAA
jgi:hypothetical protein